MLSWIPIVSSTFYIYSLRASEKGATTMACPGLAVEHFFNSRSYDHYVEVPYITISNQKKIRRYQTNDTFRPPQPSAPRTWFSELPGTT